MNDRQMTEFLFWACLLTFFAVVLLMVLVST
jgi:hypothetical protein